MTILKVLLPLPLPAFSFLPPHGQPLPEVGMRVVVPWQAGVRIGIVSAHDDIPGQARLELKEAIGTLEPWPWLSEAALATVQRIADYTFTPAGLVLANLLPTGLSDELRHELRALPGVTGIPLTELWQEAAKVPPRELELYRRQGLIEERVAPKLPTEQVLEPVKPPDEALNGPRQAAQRTALEALWSLGSASSAAALARLALVPESAVRNLVRKGYAHYVTRLLAPPPPPSFPARALPEDVAPAPAGLKPQLVVGGSRKERLAALFQGLKDELARGHSVLVLVPEAVLVAEVAGFLSSSCELRVLYGDLDSRARDALWKSFKETPLLLVATYLGLLAPLKNLSRIVVLEEASASYKLNSGCRVFVPRAATFLAEAQGAAIVYSESAPSPELAAQAEPFRLATLAPRTHVVNLNASSGWPLSSDLVRVLKQVAERSRQAVILSPRRGFSASLQCPSCAWVAMCPNCALALRYHREDLSLRCHQCGHLQRSPSRCPNCHGDTISPRGPGTQWVAREVAQLLPSMRVYRYDSDRRDDLGELLAGEPGIVVATTALLRHPPLPLASLIAVTLLDGMMNVGDFRSDEYSYRLLMSLPELSLQPRPLLVLQTFQEDASALRAFCSPEPDGFSYVQGLLERRRQFAYPPFASLAHVQVAAKQAPAAEQAANWLAGAIKAQGATEAEVLGPVTAGVARLRGYYCHQIVLRASTHPRLEQLVKPVLAYRGPARVRLDVDPRELSGLLE